ncbi:MAG: winged helix-turn-helix transcriptional regulator [Candidatus Thorarchaeota archaeon]
MSSLEIALPLNDIDIDILLALEKEGAKTSTRNLSKILDIPDRTIRYRLNRLKEKELLHPLFIQTYERKIGLAEKALFLRSVPSKESALKDILDKIPIFYNYATTHGTYDGFIVYSMFPIASSHMITRLAEEMKDAGLIEDYYEFDLVDYRTKGVNVEAFLTGHEWDWQRWYGEIGKIIDDCETVDMNFEEFPQVVSFDFKDIQIIMNMIENAEITLKELSEILQLSQPQVHKRIKSLEDSGIIRGYKPSFRPFKDGTSVGIVFKSRKHAKEILCAIHRLPFFVSFAMENINHYFLTIYVPSGEMNSLLQGINRIKQYTDEFFTQTLICVTTKGHLHLLKNYNQETKQWDIPVSDYINLIREKSQQ